MTDSPFSSPAAVVKRNGRGQPLIIPPDGGKPVAYSRWSSFGNVLEDTYNLERWGQRMVAVGLADRPDLVLSVAAHRDDKAQLNDICEQAREAAKASAKATTGTALHKLSELVDRGQPLPTLSSEAAADLEAYRRAMEPLTVVATEQFVVCDEMQAAGTFDRIVEWQGGRFIGDIKTGSIEWGLDKIAIQLAGYSRSVAYDPATGDRTPLDVDQNNALIIHLPSGSGTAELIWINIAKGWEGVQLAAEVRQWRRKKELTAPFVDTRVA